jgi:hypothetical protein
LCQQSMRISTLMIVIQMSATITGQVKSRCSPKVRLRETHPCVGWWSCWLRRRFNPLAVSWNKSVWEGTFEGPI